MSKRVTYIIVGVGILLGLVLLGFRIEGQIATPNTLGMFSGLLGFEGPQTYAILYETPKESSLLFVVKVQNGSASLMQVFPASSLGLAKTMSLADASRAIAEKLKASGTESTNAVGFVTSDAAGKIVDSFAGFKLNGSQIKSSELTTLIHSLTASSSAVDNLNRGLSINGYNLFTHGPALLAVVKEIFSANEGALYFLHESPFGKSCLGACDSEWSNQFF